MVTIKKTKIGPHIDGGSLRLCHEPDTTPHQVDLRACTVDGIAKDWILSVDVPNKLLTDAIMGDLWQHDLLLSRAKDNWAGGKYMLSLDDALSVCRRAMARVQDHSFLTAETNQAVKELALWVAEPSVREWIPKGGFATFLGYLIRDPVLILPERVAPVKDFHDEKVDFVNNQVLAIVDPVEGLTAA